MYSETNLIKPYFHDFAYNSVKVYHNVLTTALLEFINKDNLLSLFINNSRLLEVGARAKKEILKENGLRSALKNTVFFLRVKEYSSIRGAARELKVCHPTLLNYIDKDKLFKGKCVIKRKKKLINKIY